MSFTSFTSKSANLPKIYIVDCTIQHVTILSYDICTVIDFKLSRCSLSCVRRIMRSVRNTNTESVSQGGEFTVSRSDFAGTDIANVLFRLADLVGDLSVGLP